jgi:hypothetical protein
MANYPSWLGDDGEILQNISAETLYKHSMWKAILTEFDDFRREYRNNAHYNRIGISILSIGFVLALIVVSWILQIV